MVIWGEVVDEIFDKCIALAGHHEADREARRMSGRSDKIEAPQRSQAAFAGEVEVQHDT